MAKKADGIKESTDSNATIEEEETRGYNDDSWRAVVELHADNLTYLSVNRKLRCKLLTSLTSEQTASDAIIFYD